MAFGIYSVNATGVRQTQKGNWQGVRDVIARILLAAVGGYAVMAACTVLLARVLPGQALDRTLWATILSFAIYAGLVVWTFAARSALRAGAVLLAIGAVAGLCAWWAA
ncbi:hypothetical protein [Caulobacter endophyticus]|uniref:hypothetical protein n=1 Tax=Caulobacter endophyticus TaxID=2172652 RepID=UPI002410631B|nr:hypothetical protein [Caulobacter endophyticus]MDG2527292.1 hypothetical protein [Caulobacter endophyticus]